MTNYCGPRLLPVLRVLLPAIVATYCHPSSKPIRKKRRRRRRTRTLLLQFHQTIMLLAAAVVGLSLPQCCHGFADAAKGPLLLEQASNWLEESLGVSGLCHPQSNDYAPAFPKCTDTSTLDIDHHHRRRRRRLAQENNYYSNSEEEDGEASESRSWEYYLLNGGLALVCVVAGGLAAGLTVGLLSLDPLLLVIKMRAGETALERQQAEQLLPLIKNHHLLLVTLLLLNTVAGEALPIFLQSLMSNSLAVVASVVLVLVFGEILPTALFTGPNQLSIASRLTPLVKVLIFLMYPVTYPIARLLDKMMHDDDDDDDGPGGGENNDTQHTSGVTLYNRGELAALIRVQYEERLIAKQRRKHRRVSSLAGVPDLDFAAGASSDIRALTAGLLQHHAISPDAIVGPRCSHRNNNMVMSSDSIDADEVTMMEGALQMKTKRAVDIFVSFHKVFCISADMLLNDANIFSIYASGYSRVPVFMDGDKRRVKGILMTRQLIVINQMLARNSSSTAATTTTTTPDDDADNAYHCHPPLVSDLSLHIPQCVSPDTNLIELVNLFQTGGSAVRAGHMAFICARPDIANAALERAEAVPEDAGLMGIITLEDVLEALLQEQIYDEMDAAGRIMPHRSEEDQSPLDPVAEVVAGQDSNRLV